MFSQDKKLVLFFNGNRGIEVYKYLKQKKYKILYIIISYKFLQKEVITFLKKNKINYKIVHNLNDESLKFYYKEKPDLNIVCGFPLIFSEKLIKYPNYGSINLHAGALPMYRGGSPLNWQIINNEKYIRISCIKMSIKIDEGPILSKYRFKLKKNYDIRKVHKIVNASFPKITAKAIRLLVENNKSFKPQNKKFAKYYNQRNAEDGKINWKDMTNLQVFNLVRAITRPYPGAFTFDENKRKIIIFKVAVSKLTFDGAFPGEVISRRKQIYVKCKRGLIKIIESSKSMNNCQLLN